MKYLPYKEIEPDNTNLYDNGTPFDKPELIYGMLIQNSIPYLKTNQPVFIPFIGGQSSGKTTLGIHFIDIYNYLYDQPLTDLKEPKNPQYSQGNKDFLHRLPICGEQGYHAHEWDEGGRYTRKNSLTQDNKILDEALDVLRVHKVAVIYCRHDIHKIPREMIDHEIIGYMIRCKMRNPEADYVEAEVYYFIGVQYIIDFINKGMKPQQVFNKLVYPAFHFRFKNLSPTRSRQLDQMCSDKKLDMWKHKDIKSQGLLNIEELTYNIPRSKIWIKQKIKQLNIEAKMVLKKRNYYPKETIEKLNKLLKRG
jgi:hypothetical protein